MDTNLVRPLIESLMGKHGISQKGWLFEWTTDKTRAGVCKMSKKIIGISHDYAKLNTVEEVTDTILHEIAHALVGIVQRPTYSYSWGRRPKRDIHGPEWRRVAMSIGCSGNRCTTMKIVAEKPRYTLTCPKGHTIQRHKLTRRTARSSCSRCSSSYNPDFGFKITQNF